MVRLVCFGFGVKVIIEAEACGRKMEDIVFDLYATRLDYPIEWTIVVGALVREWVCYEVPGEFILREMTEKEGVGFKASFKASGEAIPIFSEGGTPQEAIEVIFAGYPRLQQAAA